MSFANTNEKLFNWKTEEVVCPYCGYIHEDSWEFDDNGRYECNHCGKEFEFERIVDVHYTTSRIENETQNNTTT